MFWAAWMALAAAAAPPPGTFAKKQIVLECPSSVVAGARSDVRPPWQVTNNRVPAVEIGVELEQLVCYYGAEHTNPYLRLKIPKGVSCVAIEGKKLAAQCTRK
jgi:hypothetical protein